MLNYLTGIRLEPGPSMKVPPKRKGNGVIGWPPFRAPGALNESPSEKEGKSRRHSITTTTLYNPQ